MLAAEVENFEQSQNVILTLLASFRDLEFTSSYQWLLTRSSKRAIQLLAEVDVSYQRSGAYRVAANPQWNRNGYVNAMFGLQGEQQVRDYLNQNSDFTQEFATRFARPLVAFLRGTSQSPYFSSRGKSDWD